jgi:hypothetical protein
MILIYLQQASCHKKCELNHCNIPFVNSTRRVTVGIATGRGRVRDKVRGKKIGIPHEVAKGTMISR